MITYQNYNKIDVLIAEKVMGKDVSERVRLICCGEFDFPYKYSEEIDKAWLIIEKLREKKLPLSIAHVYHPADDRWEYLAKVEFPGSSRVEFEVSDSAPHAICLAALSAVGVKMEDL